MAEVCIYIVMPSYLREWFVNERGGSEPVKLLRGSVESHIFETFLRSPRVDDIITSATEDCVAITIPEFRYKKSESANFLPPSAHEAFVGIVRRRFDMQLFQDLSKFHCSGKERADLIYAWMDSNGISDLPENFYAIEKRYVRMLKRYNNARNQAKWRNKKKSKSAFRKSTHEIADNK